MGLPFSAWLYRIAHNLLSNQCDRSRVTEVSITTDPGGSEPFGCLEAVMVRKQDNAYLLELINELTLKSGLIVLKFVQNFPIRKLGSFSKTEGNQSLYHRTLTELKEKARNIPIPVSSKSEGLVLET